MYPGTEYLYFHSHLPSFWQNLSSVKYDNVLSPCPSLYIFPLLRIITIDIEYMLRKIQGPTPSYSSITLSALRHSSLPTKYDPFVICSPEPWGYELRGLYSVLNTGQVQLGICYYVNYVPCIFFYILLSPRF